MRNQERALADLSFSEKSAESRECVVPGGRLVSRVGWVGTPSELGRSYSTRRLNDGTGRAVQSGQVREREQESVRAAVPTKEHLRLRPDFS